MKKTILPILVVILLVILIFVILYLYKNNNNDNSNTNNISNTANTHNIIEEPEENENIFTLKIIESSWSGWSESYEPDEVEKDYDVVLDEDYSINNGDLTFTIEEVNEDNIVIKTTEAFSDTEEGINLNTKKKTFTVYLDEELELTTPTMDAGNIYYLTLAIKGSEKKSSEKDKIKVEYNNSGGFGTMADVGTVTVTITSTKAVLSYKDEVTKTISIKEEDFSDLVELINKKFYDIDEDADSDNSILDGSTSYISVTNKDTDETYSVGGYMPQNKDYKEIENEIYNVIGKDTISDFRKNEMTEYIENNEKHN